MPPTAATHRHHHSSRLDNIGRSQLIIQRQRRPTGQWSGTEAERPMNGWVILASGIIGLSLPLCLSVCNPLVVRLSILSVANVRSIYS